MIERLLQLLFPPKCVLCGRILEKEQLDLCRKCRTDAPECPISKKKFSFLDSWTSMWYYEKDVRRSILRFKFHGKRHYAAAYGRLLAMKLQREHPDGFDLLTWVPISQRRKHRRGYDQVELLAQAVGQELGMQPVALLRKVRHNPPQSGIRSESARRANVLGAYEVLQAEALQDRTILLLDDVITTGATAGECARVLLTAGAKQVHCGAVAAVRHPGKISR